MADYGPREAVVPAEHGTPVTPNDSTNLTIQPRAISIATAGNVHMIIGGSEITVALPAGLFPIRPTRIYSTDTTATGISAWW